MIRSLGQQLNGDVQLAYQLTGFMYTLDVPVTSLTGEGFHVIVNLRAGRHLERSRSRL
jgi:hypothetical protein